MTLEDNVYCGDLQRSLQVQRPLDETSEKANEVSNRIRSLYDAGVPFYSKEAIRYINRQLKNGSEKVLVKGIDGVVVDIEVETGQPFDMGDQDTDFVIGAPFIHYLPAQWLISHTFGYVPRLSYCSMWIGHLLTKRNRKSKVFITPDPPRPQKEVEEFFTTNRRAWEASDQREQFLSIMQTTDVSHVDKIVAFACGRMAHSDQEPWAWGSAYQHALILTLRNILTERQGHAGSIRCYAQDPAYTEVDREILGRSGITVLDDPQGFLDVDDSTAVLSFGANIPVRQIIADIARPAMMIWDRISFFEDELNKSFGTDPDSPRVTNMIQSSYDEIDFPGDLEAFGPVCIYTRRNQSS